MRAMKWTLLLGLFCLVPCRGEAAIGIVSGNNCYQANGGSGDTVACTITNQSSGNMNIVVAEFCANAACTTSTSSITPSVSDDSNSYSMCGSQANHTTSGFMIGFQIFYDANINSDASNPITVTATGAYYLKILAVEVTGQDQTSPCDATGSAIQAGVSSPVSVSTSGSTTQNNELVYAAAGTSAAGLTAGTGYTAINNSGGIVTDEYKIVSSTGTQTATWTYSGTANNLSVIATFKEASGAPTPAKRRIIN